MRTLYCPGIPGGASDLDAVLPRGAARPDVYSEANSLPDGPVRLVGFSLGAVTALRLARDFPDKVKEVVLVSPAAPLALGDFLPDMAGAPVFALARRWPTALGAVLALQGLAARLAPGRTLDTLFASAGEAEVRWLDRPGVRTALVLSLRDSYGARRAATVRRLVNYSRASPANWLSDVRAPVRIIHGTDDRWTPPAMADALAARLGADVEWHDGLGHFGTLAEVMPDLMARPQIHLRPVRPNEAERLAAFARALFETAFAAQNDPADLALYCDEAFAPTRVARELAEPLSRFTVAEVDGQWAGYLKTNTGTARTEDISGLEVERLYVHADHQGRGVGAALMAHAEATARTLGLERLWLGVWEENARALAVYTKLGFITFGEHDYLIGTDLQRDLLLERPVPVAGPVAGRRPAR